MRRLDDLVGDAGQYVSINCLRRWEKLYETPIENQIYIHSKLMIADDRIAICGS
eukprot:Pgem_evm1s17335